MSKSVIKVDKEIRHCDYCGASAEGMYSSCDCCGKDICHKHRAAYLSEDESYCYVCYEKGHKWIMEEMSRQAEERRIIREADIAAHPGQLKIDGVWIRKEEVLFGLTDQLKCAINEGNAFSIDRLSRKIIEMSNRKH